MRLTDRTAWESLILLLILPLLPLLERLQRYTSLSTMDDKPSIIAYGSRLARGIIDQFRARLCLTSQANFLAIVTFTSDTDILENSRLFY